jgi:hypothetical protein
VHRALLDGTESSAKHPRQGKDASGRSVERQYGYSGRADAPVDRSAVKTGDSVAAILNH